MRSAAQADLTLLETHTLATPDDQQGDTVVWFAVQGANITLDKPGGITQVIEAAFVPDAYRGFCDATGQSYAKLIVARR